MVNFYPSQHELVNCDSQNWAKEKECRVVEFRDADAGTFGNLVYGRELMNCVYG